MHALISPIIGERWNLTTVYASPRANIRASLWDDLNEMELIRPSMAVGDFNCVIHGEERNSGNGASSIFANWVVDRGLIDMGFSGPRFTWNHGASAEMRGLARLDRELCNADWRRIFPKATVKHLAYSYSNHCPLLIHLAPSEGNSLGQRAFHFQAA